MRLAACLAARSTSSRTPHLLMSVSTRTEHWDILFSLLLELSSKRSTLSSRSMLLLWEEAASSTEPPPTLQACAPLPLHTVPSSADLDWPILSADLCCSLCGQADFGAQLTLERCYARGGALKIAFARRPADVPLALMRFSSGGFREIISSARLLCGVRVECGILRAGYEDVTFTSCDRRGGL